jgi:hypothetical protein
MRIDDAVTKINDVIVGLKRKMNGGFNIWL